MKGLTLFLGLSSLYALSGCAHWSPMVGVWTEEGLKPGDVFFMSFDKNGSYHLGGYVHSADFDGGGTYSLANGKLTLYDTYGPPATDTITWLGPNEIKLVSAGSTQIFKRS